VITTRPRDGIDFQLALLDAYEQLLASCCWDEARLNDTLKSVMAVTLPLLRAQRALGEQLLAAHRQMLQQYRQALEASLRQPGGGGLGGAF
jgi:hypothetical protein